MRYRVNAARFAILKYFGNTAGHRNRGEYHLPMTTQTDMTVANEIRNQIGHKAGLYTSL
jgi:hypothetical protein